MVIFYSYHIQGNSLKVMIVDKLVKTTFVLISPYLISWLSVPHKDKAQPIWIDARIFSHYCMYMINQFTVSTTWSVRLLQSICYVRMWQRPFNLRWFSNKWDHFPEHKFGCCPSFKYGNDDNIRIRLHLCCFKWKFLVLKS